MRYIILVFIFTIVSVGVDATDNLLKNSSFEEILNIGLENTSVPGWTVTDSRTALVKQDCAMGLFGVRSLKIQFRELPEQGDWMISQQIERSEFKNNTDYRFTGWLNSYKGSAAFKISLLKNNQLLKEYLLPVWDEKDTYDIPGVYIEKTLRFNTADCDAIRIDCLLKNSEQFKNDTVWFDGLKLVEDLLATPAPADPGLLNAKLYVDASVSNGDGSREKPFKTIQAALDKAGAGTTIYILPGKYYERLRFPRSGSAAAPITLSGAPETRLYGSKPLKLSWKAVPEWGEGVYASTPQPALVRGVYVLKSPRSREALKLPLIRYERAGDRAKKSDHPYHFRNIFKHGIMSPEKQPGQGFDVIQAVAMYNPEDHRVYVRFGDNADPNSMRFVFADGGSVADIENTAHVVIENLHFSDSVKGVLIRRSENITVRNCTFTTIEYGIHIMFSSHVIISGNTLSLNAIHTSNPFHQAISTPNGIRYQPDVWRTFKWVGYYDRIGIIINNSRNSEISDNYINGHWDGIAVSHNVKDLKVLRNYVADITDDGFTVHGDSRQIWAYNIVMNSFANLRYWDNPRNQGPVYIYGNYFIHGRQDNIRLMEDTDMEIYVYHNTTIGGDGIRYHGQKSSGTPNLHVYNNRFAGNFFGMTSRVKRAKVVPNFKSGYNTYLADPADVIKKYGMNINGFQGFDNRGKGVDLSKFFGKALPGCPENYFEGAAPDCGAEVFKHTFPVRLTP